MKGLGRRIDFGCLFSRFRVFSSVRFIPRKQKEIPGQLIMVRCKSTWNSPTRRLPFYDSERLSLDVSPCILDNEPFQSEELKLNESTAKVVFITISILFHTLPFSLSATAWGRKQLGWTFRRKILLFASGGCRVEIDQKRAYCQQASASSPSVYSALLQIVEGRNRIFCSEKIHKW